MLYFLFSLQISQWFRDFQLHYTVKIPDERPGTRLLELWLEGQTCQTQILSHFLIDSINDYVKRETDTFGWHLISH